MATCNCGEPATFSHHETACQRDHCPTCVGRCRACQEEIASEMGDEL